MIWGYSSNNVCLIVSFPHSSTGLLSVNEPNALLIALSPNPSLSRLTDHYDLQKDKEDLEEVSTELELADEDELVP